MVSRWNLLIISLLAAMVSTTAAQESVMDQWQGTVLAPRAFRAAAEIVKPSLVRIETFGGLTAAAAGAEGFRPGEGPTTGVIVTPEGHILTSTFNFLKKPPVITVILSTGTRKVAQMLGRDETRHLCLLKIEPDEPLPVPQWAPRGDLQVGQWAVALGVGFGEKEAALSAGIISATQRMGAKAVQTDANLGPANYGGPLIDIEGKLIGICVPMSPGASAASAGAEWYDSGIGFAVPLSPSDKVFTALKEGKTLVGGFLGVQTKPVDKFQPGAEVVQVVPKSPAEAAKLAAKDIILGIDGTAANDPTHLSALMQRYVAGDQVQLQVRRGDETLQLSATLGTVPPPEPKKKPDPKKIEDPKQPQPEDEDQPAKDTTD